jgi:hypothetical protein
MQRALKILIICMSIMWTGLALADKDESPAQGCKKGCSEMMPYCEDACKKQGKTSEQRQRCVSTCKKAVNACSAECNKQGGQER